MQNGLLGWPRGNTAPGLRVQVDTFAVTGAGPYPLSSMPDGGLMLAFFDGILQPAANFTTNAPARQAAIASGVATSSIATFTLAYSVSLG